MKKGSLLLLFVTLLFAYCKSKPSFTEQVKQDFSNRVLKIDSSVRVDSFQLVRMDSLTVKIGQIVYDSIFAREEARLEAELSTMKLNKADTNYKQEEINYMKKELDSIENLIVNADTVKKYGVLGIYHYSISKNGQSKSGRIYYFISNNGNVLNPDMISDSLKKVVGGPG
ncbi:MAG TPA: hypothetical protein VFE04_08605 [Puia sp.]|nr:hypothetical protein [Puia sp.]